MYPDRTGQRWTIRFDGQGVYVWPDRSDWNWGLSLSQFGTSARLHRPSCRPDVSAKDGRLEYAWSPAITEWYVNDERGLEHGFTVHAPIEHDGESSLVIDLTVRGELHGQVDADGLGVRFVDEAGSCALTYDGLVAFDANGRDLDASLSAHGRGLRLTVDVEDAVYPVTIDPVAQQAYLKASNTDAGDGFGRSVAVSGDTAVIGAPGERSNATGVNGNQANNSGVNTGAAYVFRRTGGTWAQEAYLKASNSELGDLFGVAVGISGDTIAVGATFEDSNATGVNGNQANNSEGAAGAVYVFQRTGSTWTQQAYLKASNTGNSDRFGSSVAVSGNTIVVGAPNEDSSATGVDGNGSDNSVAESGAAYVFHRTGSTWTQQAYLKASNTGSGDQFGWSVSVSGDLAVVGAYLEDSLATGIDGDGSTNGFGDSGAAYVFRRAGTVWAQDAFLKASNTGPGDNFGYSVDVSGDTVAVGALFEDSNATGIDGFPGDSFLTMDSGAAYVFAFSSGTWSQEAYVKASNTEEFDQFGSAVAISGDTVVVGATGESSNATGVNGNQGNNSSGFAGAAYVFARTGSTWSQQSYLKASNTGALDGFGGQIDVSGDLVVIGVQSEDSAATGIDGNGSDNTAAAAGAGYAFDLDTGNTGCPGALPPLLSGPPSASAGFTVTCPPFVSNCSGSPVVIFGECSPFPIPIDPLGCGTCTLAVNPAFGAVGPLVVGPGLPVGFSFCAQCACIAGACIELGISETITIVP
ncbi:MAG: hypothetical protein KDB80_15775 [Planctomycetes bacterium]|nr:hypothetical protein [Planctomycetota bacterium]